MNKNKKKFQKRPKVKQFQSEDAEIKQLKERIMEETPAPGVLYGNATKFEELPISHITKNGLKTAKFETMTDIQRAAIPHALAGRDILGAAKTGSGKTLAFIVPVLEKLFHEKWDTELGLGALILSPTRELALQIFEILRSVGKFHVYSAGLVTGGKDFKEEQVRICKMNILVATPGRLLQHLQQTPDFDLSSIQILVIDEADRILDMGFETQLNDILSYLPPTNTRQNLLFSATQNKSISNLVKLSLNHPEYIGVHDKDALATPEQLVQRYMIIPIEEKLDVLYSFIKSHLKCKILVFVNSCKEVRFLYESFRQIKPGVPVMQIHGRQKQSMRTYEYFDFLEKEFAVLFCTDIAARGLDFPKVNWVLQYDCPEDYECYIHRVGRTARYKDNGQGLLFLLPSEIKMIEILSNKKIPLQKIAVNPQKKVSMTQILSQLLAKDVELKSLAQKAFTCYLRSVYLMPNKEVFKVSEIDQGKFAESMGLAIMPKLELKENESRETSQKKKLKLQKLREKQKLLKEEKKMKKKEEKNNKKMKKDDDEEEKEEEEKEKKNKRNNKMEEEEESEEEEEENDDDIIKVKRKSVNIDDIMNEYNIPINDNNNKISNPKKKIKIKNGVVVNGGGKHIIFNHSDNENNNEDNNNEINIKDIDELDEEELKKESKLITEMIKSKLEKADVISKQKEKLRVKQKRLLMKQRNNKSEIEEEDGDENDENEEEGEKGVQLGNSEDEDDDDDDENVNKLSDESDDEEEESNVNDLESEALKLLHS